VDKDLFFVPDDGGRRGHSRKLLKRRCGLDIKKLLETRVLVSKRLEDKNESLGLLWSLGLLVLEHLVLILVSVLKKKSCSFSRLLL